MTNLEKISYLLELVEFQLRNMEHLNQFIELTEYLEGLKAFEESEEVEA